MAQAGIQADWEAREFIEIVSGSIGRIAEFLNDFGENQASSAASCPHVAVL